MDLPTQIREAMVAHARFCLPREACGLLAMDGAGRLRMAYCLTNADRSEDTFTIDPYEHVKALRHAERAGWRLGGVFHSHPRGAARPSPVDVARALEPDWLYAVVGTPEAERPDVRGFWIRHGRVVEEPLVVTAGANR
jgi:proteasome lid subunit RPN8/RPN11